MTYYTTNASTLTVLSALLPEYTSMWAGKYGPNRWKTSRLGRNPIQKHDMIWVRRRDGWVIFHNQTELLPRTGRILSLAGLNWITLWLFCFILQYKAKKDPQRLWQQSLGLNTKRSTLTASDVFFTGMGGKMPASSPRAWLFNLEKTVEGK